MVVRRLTAGIALTRIWPKMVTWSYAQSDKFFIVMNSMKYTPWIHDYLEVILIRECKRLLQVDYMDWVLSLQIGS